MNILVLMQLYLGSKDLVQIKLSSILDRSNIFKACFKVVGELCCSCTLLMETLTSWLLEQQHCNLIHKSSSDLKGANLFSIENVYTYDEYTQYIYFKNKYLRDVHCVRGMA